VEGELARLPAAEQAAMLHAIEKLEALGPRGFNNAVGAAERLLGEIDK